MPKAKKSKSPKTSQKRVITKTAKPKLHNNNKLMIIGAILALILIGKLLYKSMLTSPDINKITTGDPEQDCILAGKKWSMGKCFAVSSCKYGTTVNGQCVQSINATNKPTPKPTIKPVKKPAVRPL